MDQAIATEALTTVEIVTRMRPWNHNETATEAAESAM